jgi:putative phosphoserine phosphatase/1-acylglycerol-3-phosphate O-acyltransferase
MQAMGTAAAFVDLDRTLLRGASGPALSRALREAGIVESRFQLGENLLYRVFDLIGETRPSIELARQAARFARGWSQAEVQAAAVTAADALVAAVQPYAHAMLAEHQAAGRPVVLATTTPHDLVDPLAERLGFDAVIATRYGVGDDGRYDGTIDGELVWGRGKLRSVQRWADDNGVDLSASWAYSDSFYDTPLLGAVGHPVAVNPDPRLLAMALVRRWPVSHLDVPEGVPKMPVLGIEPQQVVLQMLRPELYPWVNVEASGDEHIPRSGPAILAANHRSYFDPFALGMAFGRLGRPARFLGKKEVFDAPVVGPVVRALGGIRVDRGSGSDEPMAAAAAALAAGELVVVLPQGTIPRGPEFFDPELKGRWGTARLAAMTKAPVIPVALWGTENVWPRSERLPRLWQVIGAPRVAVRAGPPVELKYKSPNADTKRIMKAIAALLPDEARELREPTPEELARTYPPGKAPQNPRQ